MNKQMVIAFLNEFIKSNGLQEITGSILNSALTAIANIIPDEAMLTSSFGGGIDEDSVEPANQTEPIWYFAKGGNYTNFGGYDLLSKNLNIIFFNGTMWQKVEVELPSNTAEKVFNPLDDENPSTMKAAAKRWDVALKVLDYFVKPSTTSIDEIVFPQNNEVADKYLDIYFHAQPTVGTHYGDISISSLAGYDKLVIEGNLQSVGFDCMWLGGINRNHVIDSNFRLCVGSIVGNRFEINVSDLQQYEKLAYSRRTDNGVRFYKYKTVYGSPQLDAVYNLIMNQPKGYSGEIDCGALGVSPTKSSFENAQIINRALLDAETQKKIVRLPPGIIPTETINLRQDSILIGAGVFKTRLVGVTGTTSKVAIQFSGQPQARVTIKDMWIDAENFTDGAVYLNFTVDAQIKNIIIFNGNLYGFYLARCLYHSIEDVWVSNIDGVGLWTVDSNTIATNLNSCHRVYFENCHTLCVKLERGSNYRFETCNFESSGKSNNETTGGVHAIGLSPNGEGVDVVFSNCWSEGVKGGFVYKFENCKGSSVIEHCMMGNGGEGAGIITNAVVNINSKVELSGATRFSEGVQFSPYPTNVRTTNNGSTIISNPHINVGASHIESSGGTFKTAVYS